jgi:hypothetical protein
MEGIVMTIKTYFIIISIIGVVNGLGFLLAPTQFGPIYGWHETPDIQLAGRYFGGALLAWALIAWFAKDFQDFTAVRGVLIPSVIGHFAGLVVTVIGILSGILNVVAWAAALSYLFGLVGAVYFLKPRSHVVHAG